MNESTIEIVHLGRLDALTLIEEFEAAGVASEERKPLPGPHGELATITIVAALAAPVVVALAAWLLRKVRNETVTVIYRVSRRDGTTEECTFTHTLSSAEAPTAELVKALAASMKIPLSN